MNRRSHLCERCPSRRLPTACLPPHLPLISPRISPRISPPISPRLLLRPTRPSCLGPLRAGRDERLLNAKAREILKRVDSKLLGTDFAPDQPPIRFPTAAATALDHTTHAQGGAISGHAQVGAAGSLGSADKAPEPEALDIATQVDRLILEAQSHANLCQLYSGWNPYW